MKSSAKIFGDAATIPAGIGRCMQLRKFSPLAAASCSREDMNALPAAAACLISLPTSTSIYPVREKAFKELKQQEEARRRRQKTQREESRRRQKTGSDISGENFPFNTELACLTRRRKRTSTASATSTTRTTWLFKPIVPFSR